MRASAGAAIGVVAKGVNVHATLGVGVIAGDIVGDVGWAALRVLLEGHGALDIGVTTENCDCCCTSLAVCHSSTSHRRHVGREWPPAT